MSTITWDAKGETGYEDTDLMKRLVYNPTYGFSEYIIMLLNISIQDPENFQNNKIVCRNDPLYQIRPSYIGHRIMFKADTIKASVLTQFKYYLTIMPVNSPMTDFEFLARLSLQRYWNHSCMICLEEHIGKTCQCGHCDVVIFRPCGHSMCLYSCFMDFMGVALPVVTTADGRTVQCVHNINMDTNFECPTCRNVVTQTFNSNDARYSKIFDPFVDQMVSYLRRM